MKKILALILALVMCFSLVACGGEKDDAKTDDKAQTSQGTNDKKEDKPASNPANEDLEPIKIGILIPLSGGSATSGVTMKYVADLIADEINNELGGIQNFGGRPIELVYGDTQSDATVSAAEFERLMEEGCVAYIGGYNSPISQSLAPQVIANDQIMIMVNAFANGAFTTPNDNVWHVSGTAAVSEPFTAERTKWQRENLEGFDGSVYGYIYTASDYGRDAYENLVATKDASGVKEIVGVPVESGASDLSSVLMKLKERDDVQYLSCAIPMADAILFVRQCQQYDVTVPIFAGGSGFCWADILEQIGESSDYLFTTGTYFADWYRNTYDPELAQEYNKACKDAIGWLPDENYSCMWGDMWTLWDALERAESLEVADIKTALRETNITGEHKALLMTAHKSITLPESTTGQVTGTVIYNCNPDYIPLWAMSKDMEYRIVWPEEYANPDYPIVYPVPSWEDR